MISRPSGAQRDVVFAGLLNTVILLCVVAGVAHPLVLGALLTPLLMSRHKFVGTAALRPRWMRCVARLFSCSST